MLTVPAVSVDVIVIGCPVAAAVSLAVAPSVSGTVAASPASDGFPVEPPDACAVEPPAPVVPPAPLLFGESLLLQPNVAANPIATSTSHNPLFRMTPFSPK